MYPTASPMRASICDCVDDAYMDFARRLGSGAYRHSDDNVLLALVTLVALGVPLAVIWAATRDALQCKPPTVRSRAGRLTVNQTIPR